MMIKAKQPGALRRLLAAALTGAVLLCGSLPIAASAADSASAWQFAAFGASTSSKANTVDEGADIGGKVTLTSCAVKDDGTIDKKGGKFVADSPADGISFYYTTIDPQTQNFYLQADVTVDYINPSPDGQEGFALMVRDSISGSGSYFSNQFSAAGTKLPLDGAEIKDAIGARGYTGIIANEDAASNDVSAVREAFSADTIKQGETYRLSLEKTANGYVATRYEIKANGSTGKVIGQSTLYITAKDPSATSVSSYAELDDPMAAQEADTAYVGLAAARGVNVTFSNIVYRTSEWKAADWKIQPTSYITPDYQITSPSTSTGTYDLVFKANADGEATVYVNDAVSGDSVRLAAGEELARTYALGEDTTFAVQFTPDADYAPSAYEKLSDYSIQKIEKLVSVRTLGADGKIYVSPTGSAANGGTSADDAVDIQTALSYAGAGQTVLLESGTYSLTDGLTIERGREGTEVESITVTTADGKYATLDFGGVGTGLSAWGNWWNFSKMNITRTADGAKGMQLAGSHCVVENMNFYNNGNTGLQISGVSTDSKDKWPSYNTVRNCTSMNNADRAMEDADGFAAKLTCGEGNVFDGCTAAYNADDGWDLFAKASTGSIGAVTIQNCLAYRNGYISLRSEPVKKQPLEFPNIKCDDNGNILVEDSAVIVDAGNGNGFKMGGTNLPGGHVLKNSIAYYNAAKGIDSNSCPDIKIYNCTSYNNGGANVALYTNNKSATTDFHVEGLISYRKGTDVEENIKLQGQSEADVYGESNFYWSGETQTSSNTAGETVSDKWFRVLDTTVAPVRAADGAVDMHGVLQLSVKGMLASASGARGEPWGVDIHSLDSIKWAVTDLIS